MLSDKDEEFVFLMGALGIMILLIVLITTGLWPILVLFLAVLVCLFCFYKAHHSFRTVPEMRTDVDLETLDKYDENDELIKEDPELNVQSSPARGEDAEPQGGYWKFPSPDTSADDALLNSPLHLAEGLTPTQVSTLERQEYALKEFVPLGKTRREKFYIQEQSSESFEHTFVVHSLVTKLKPYVQDLEVQCPQQPDIVFFYKGHRYALEVETPHHLPHKHARLSRKAQRLTKEYGVRWWFVTTRSAYAKTFHPYGQVLTRNQIDSWLKETFSLPASPPLNTI